MATIAADGGSSSVGNIWLIELMLLSLLVRTKSKVPVDQSVMIVTGKRDR